MLQQGAARRHHEGKLLATGQTFWAACTGGSTVGIIWKQTVVEHYMCNHGDNHVTQVVQCRSETRAGVKSFQDVMNTHNALYLIDWCTFLVVASHALVEAN